MMEFSVTIQYWRYNVLYVETWE